MCARPDTSRRGAALVARVERRHACSRRRDATRRDATRCDAKRCAARRGARRRGAEARAPRRAPEPAAVEEEAGEDAEDGEGERTILTTTTTIFILIGAPEGGEQGVGTRRAARPQAQLRRAGGRRAAPSPANSCRRGRGQPHERAGGVVLEEAVGGAREARGGAVARVRPAGHHAPSLRRPAMAARSVRRARW
eukprot:scaffold3766_cov289-Prasinococcus_capsulatus_cf.AAC.4